MQSCRERFLVTTTVSPPEELSEESWLQDFHWIWILESEVFCLPSLRGETTTIELTLSRQHDVPNVNFFPSTSSDMTLGTSSPKSFQRIFGIIRQRPTWQWDSVCMISRYGSIAPALAAYCPSSARVFSVLWMARHEGVLYYYAGSAWKG